MNVEAIHRTYCAPSTCTLGPRGLHVWDGSAWWECADVAELYRGRPLTCMKKRGPAAPRPAVYVPAPTSARGDVLERARRYVERMPPALAGSNGSTATFKVALTLVRGFAISPDEALAIMVEYNARCLPPWTMHELKHKVRQALKAKTRAGYLAERRRR